MLTQHYLSFPKTFWGDYRSIVLWLSSPTKWFSSNFQSSVTIFHHKLLAREGRVSANGWAHPSSMTIFVHFIHKKCHLESYRSDIKYHVTLNIIFSVEYLHLKEFLKYVCELYLRQWLTPSQRKIIAVYRTSNHRLAIKIGQWSTTIISRDNSLCHLCCYNVVEMRHTLRQSVPYTTPLETS